MLISESAPPGCSDVYIAFNARCSSVVSGIRININVLDASCPGPFLEVLMFSSFSFRGNLQGTRPRLPCGDVYNFVIAPRRPFYFKHYYTARRRSATTDATTALGIIRERSNSSVIPNPSVNERFVSSCAFSQPRMIGVAPPDPPPHVAIKILPIRKKEACIGQQHLSEKKFVRTDSDSNVSSLKQKVQSDVLSYFPELQIIVASMAVSSMDTHSCSDCVENVLAALQAKRLNITLTDAPQPVPPPDEYKFGAIHTDHLLSATFDPTTGWSAPVIKPYGPLVLDPACSVLQYGISAFEGMKAYMGADGKIRLFRPDLNVARFQRSADRLALPAFDPEQVLALLKKLVAVDARWIPRLTGYSLYLRPTIIGTRPTIGLAVSDHAIFYTIALPTGHYFRDGARPVSLLALNDHVRAWPGGTGGHKLAVNYSPALKPTREAERLGYDQVLWLLGDAVAEAGVMNFIAVVRRDDGDLDVITPALDGTILPGVTRASCLELAAAHPSRTILPGLSPTRRLYPQERTLTMTDLFAWHEAGKLCEMMVVGTAVVVASVGKVTFEGKDIVLLGDNGGRGPVSHAFYTRLLDIQEGRFEWESWGVVCE